MPYPASVTDAGLTAVWDHSTDAGLSGSLTKTLPADQASLPSGWALTTFGTEPTLAITLGSSQSDWDFTGYNIDIQGDITVSLTNCKIKCVTTKVYTVNLGDGTNAPTLNLTNCEIDGYSTITAFGGVTNINCQLGATVNASLCYFHDGALDYAKGKGSINVSDCYITSPGQYPPSDAHIEGFQFWGPSNSFKRNLFDISDWSGAAMLSAAGGWTGLIFPDAGTWNAAVSADIQDNILVIGLADKTKIPYTIQTASGSSAALTYTARNNVIEIGLSGYVGETNNGGATNRTASLNRDYASSALLTGYNNSSDSTGAATLLLAASGAGAVGASGIGAKTLALGGSASGAVYGPVIGAGSATLSLTTSAAGASVSGQGDAILSLTASGDGAQSTTASGEGALTLSLGASGAGTAGQTGTGAVTLVLIAGGLGTVSGYSAPTRGGGTKTAPGRVGKTKTASPRSSTTIIAA